MDGTVRPVDVARQAQLVVLLQEQEKVFIEPEATLQMRPQGAFPLFLGGIRVFSVGLQQQQNHVRIRFPPEQLFCTYPIVKPETLFIDLLKSSFLGVQTIYRQISYYWSNVNQVILNLKYQ